MRTTVRRSRLWSRRTQYRTLPEYNQPLREQTWSYIAIVVSVSHRIHSGPTVTKKNKSEIKLGATVRLKAQSGEIIEGRVVHMWEEKSVPMVRVASGHLIYNVPASMLVR
jgi:hypothetical protein